MSDLFREFFQPLIMQSLEDEKILAKLNEIIDERIAMHKPVPVPPPDPIPQPQPGPPINLTVWDGSTIANEMARQGWVGGTTEAEYALFTMVSGREWNLPYATETSGKLYEARNEILAWWWNKVDEIASILRNNPNARAVIIKNDENNLGGCYVGPNTYVRLVSYGLIGQIKMGEVYRP